MENDTMPAGKKIMIIVWKWTGLHHVHGSTLSDEEVNACLDDIHLGKASHFAHEQKEDAEKHGKFFAEYKVTPSRLCPDAQVVPVSIYRVRPAPDDPNPLWRKDLLFNVLDKYTSNEHDEVMLFLHRGNFYEEVDVREILQHYHGRISKCFLFAYGRDFLYYNTQQAGFLDDAGGLHRKKDAASHAVVSTFEQGQIQQPFFDRVWQYYASEFETKVLFLKEDLLDAWFPLMVNAQQKSLRSEDLRHFVDQHTEKALLERVKSFLDKIPLESEVNDFEERRQVQKERDRIVALEKEEGVSYIFDDFIGNLEEDTLIYKAYRECKKQMEDLLFPEAHREINTKNIQELAAQLNYLVKVIPGGVE
jgi:hypothetical protein